MVHLVTLPDDVNLSIEPEVVRNWRVVVPRQAERRLRVLELRDAIRSGEYRVSSPALAEALMTAARRAN